MDCKGPNSLFGVRNESGQRRPDRYHDSTCNSFDDSTTACDSLYPLDKVPTVEWDSATPAQRRELISAGRAAPEYDGPLAPEFSTCFRILETRAKRFRETSGDERARKRWWIHARTRPEMHKAIHGFHRVLVHARVTKTHAFVFVDAHQTISDQVVIFAYQEFSDFSILQCSLHDIWAWTYASTLKTDRRYSPTQCFTPFPFPTSPASYTVLQAFGETYHEHRRQLMLQMQLGLTKTYNLFHDPNLGPEVVLKASKQTADVAAEACSGLLRLRELHREMDNAVLAAYGWHEPSDDGPAIDLRHDFYEVDYLPENDRTRYTIHPDARRELLKRLLLLNHKRYAEEQAAGKKAPASGETRKGKRATKKASPQSSGPSLFDEEQTE